MLDRFTEGATTLSESSAGREGERKKQPGRGKQVLIVEDDRVIIELIQDIVSSLGFGVVVAENAAEALAEYEECADSAVCVILDYGIPGMDASRLLYRMKEINGHVKVLLSSGYSPSFIGRDFRSD